MAKVILTLLVLLTVLADFTGSKRVKERFQDGDTNYTIKLGMFDPELFDAIPPGMEEGVNILKDFLVGVISGPIRKRWKGPMVEKDLANCYVFGEPDENGTYDGIIGMIQRGELDTAILAVNPASTPHEPVIIGPLFMASDLMIISTAKKMKPVEVHILDWFQSFDGITYQYFAIICIIVSVTYIVLSKDFTLRSITRKRVLLKQPSSLGKTIWQIYCLLIDQEGFSPVTSGQKVLIAVFSLSIFFIIQVFSNLLSTDKVAESEPYYIDSIDDVIPGGRFENLKPFMMDGYWYTPPFKSAPSESQMGKLWKQISREQNYSVINPYLISNLDKKLETLKDIIEGRSYFISDADRFSRLTLETILCRITSSFGMKDRYFHFSKESFAHGTVNIVVSKKSPPGVVKLLEYSFRTINEFSLFKSRSDAIKFIKFPEMFSALSPIQGLECAAHIPEPHNPEDIFLSIHSLQPVMIYYVLALGFITIVLLLEIVTGSIGCFEKRKGLGIKAKRIKVRKKNKIELKEVKVSTTDLMLMPFGYLNSNENRIEQQPVAQPVPPGIERLPTVIRGQPSVDYLNYPPPEPIISEQVEPKEKVTQELKGSLESSITTQTTQVKVEPTQETFRQTIDVEVLEERQKEVVQKELAVTAVTRQVRRLGMTL